MCIELYISTTHDTYYYIYTLWIHFTFSSHSFQHRIVYPCGNIFSIFGAWASARLCLFYTHYGTRLLFSCFCYFGIRSLSMCRYFSFSRIRSTFFCPYIRLWIHFLSVSCAQIVCERAHFFHFISYCISINRIRIWFFLQSGGSLLCFCFSFHSIPFWFLYTFVLVNGFDISDALPISSWWNAMNHCFHSIQSESSSGIWMRWNWNKQTK